jgi:serine/threonine protein kinase
MPEMLNREVSIFNSALELPPEQRAAYLDRVCADDAALRQKVENLLRAHNQAADFMELPPRLDLDSDTAAIQIHMIPDEAPGNKIGRYKLLQKIGEGGCGVVYMAEQQEPVRRRVALKIIKIGIDTKQVVARFEAERQALAMMDHPNIARVLDAGTTEKGRPYFVMELVRGVPITEFCDQSNLSTRERLGLFVQVCKAIQHAHQKGIIHRDIKPSNILVTLHDGVPVPKVIDFGVAKAIDQPLTEKTVFTCFGQFIGTPAYMSPEQAEMSGLDIDTRSDIYSLGVLLYELLTGMPPFNRKDLLEVGLDEMRRTIREQEPVPPSKRLSTMGEADLTTTAQRRRIEPAKLPGLIRGDLDWIVLKALEKDRTRRYETANGLAADIKRHLDNEPIVAHSPSNLYRFQKAVKRNKVAFAAAALVAGSLVFGLGLSTWLYLKEKAARQRAVAAERAQSQMHQGVDKLYRLYALESVLWSQSMWAEAETCQREALRLEREFYGNDHPRVYQSLTMLAHLLNQQGKRAEADTTLHEAETMVRGVLTKRRNLLGNEHPDVLSSLKSLVVVLRVDGKWAEAETAEREALVTTKKLLGNNHPEVLSSLNDLGALVCRQGRLGEAEAIYREELQAARNATNDDETAQALASLTVTLLHDKKFDEAEPLARELWAHNEGRHLGQWYNFMSQSFLGGALLGQKKYAEAEPLLLSGYRGMNMKWFEGDWGDGSGPYRLKEVIGELVNLYEALEKPEQAAEWRKKYEEFSLSATYSNRDTFIPK